MGNDIITDFNENEGDVIVLDQLREEEVVRKEYGNNIVITHSDGSSLTYTVEKKKTKINKHLVQLVK